MRNDSFWRRRGPALAMLALVTVVVVALVVTTARAGDPGQRSPAASWSGTGRLPSTSPGGRCPHARRGLVWYQARANEHRFKLDRPHVRPGRSPRACPAIRRAAGRARSRARSLRHAYERWFDRTYEKFRCVHEHEGRWDDPHPTYYGGLQADLSFQRAYGPEYLRRWGTADRWPVWAQLRMGERGHRARGWDPWPRTSRMCGLR